MTFSKYSPENQNSMKTSSKRKICDYFDIVLFVLQTGIEHFLTFYC